MRSLRLLDFNVVWRYSAPPASLRVKRGRRGSWGSSSEGSNPEPAAPLPSFLQPTTSRVVRHQKKRVLRSWCSWRPVRCTPAGIPVGISPRLWFLHVFSRCNPWTSPQQPGSPVLPSPLLSAFPGTVPSFPTKNAPLKCLRTQCSRAPSCPRTAPTHPRTPSPPSPPPVIPPPLIDFTMFCWMWSVTQSILSCH